MPESKKYTDALKKFDRDEQYTPTEALGIVKTTATAKFDESVEMAVRLGVDPRKADQMVRGTDDLYAEIEKGNLNFDVAIATPDLMPMVGRLGRVLGPRGLMPNPKTGTVTQDVGRAVTEFKGGKVEYRTDRYGNIHVPIGKVSFASEDLERNLRAVLDE